MSVLKTYLRNHVLKSGTTIKHARCNRICMQVKNSQVTQFVQAIRNGVSMHLLA